MELKKIGVWSTGKVLAVISFIFGILLAVLLLILQKVVTGTQLAGVADLTSLTQIVPSALIILPFYYALIGFLSGVVIAFLYNLISGWIGGIKLELKEEVKKKK